jgi:hypothetical protein
MTGIWVDKLTLKAPWAEFFTGLGAEWEGHTVFVRFQLDLPSFSYDLQSFLHRPPFS